MLVYLSMIETPEEKDQFEKIYYKYRNLMYYVANGMLHNHHDSEDAVHQAFVSIIRHISKIQDVDSPQTRSFLVLITERKAIDILRTSHRDKVASLDEEMIGVEVPPPGDHGLADAMAGLPAEYREILLLKYDNGFSIKELAQMLGMSESGIRKRIGRARKALKTALEKEGGWF